MLESKEILIYSIKGKKGGQCHKIFKEYGKMLGVDNFLKDKKKNAKLKIIRNDNSRAIRRHGEDHID